MGRKVMERIYRAKNGVEEATRFWISDNAEPRTGKRNASTPRKQEANKNQAAHVLGRILNNNFEQGDLFLSPGYSGKAFRELRKRAYANLPKNAKKEEKRNAILAEAEKDGKLFLRRLREAGAKDLRYVLVAADMDGRTGKEVQVHLHIVISGDSFVLEDKKLRLACQSSGESGRQSAVPTSEDGTHPLRGKASPTREDGTHPLRGKASPTREDGTHPLRGKASPTREDGTHPLRGKAAPARTLEEIWGKDASVEYEFLRAGSYNALAAYLIRQCRSIPNRKKYSCSRNLERIEPEEYEVAVTPMDEIRVPKDAQVEERIGGPAMQYVRYVTKKKAEPKTRSARNREATKWRR